jgi:hypothetical protein
VDDAAGLRQIEANICDDIVRKMIKDTFDKTKRVFKHND